MDVCVITTLVITANNTSLSSTRVQPPYIFLVVHAHTNIMQLHNIIQHEQWTNSMCLTLGVLNEWGDKNDHNPCCPPDEYSWCMRIMDAGSSMLVLASAILWYTSFTHPNLDCLGSQGKPEIVHLLRKSYIFWENRTSSEKIVHLLRKSQCRMTLAHWINASLWSHHHRPVYALSHQSRLVPELVIICLPTRCHQSIKKLEL